MICKVEGECQGRNGEGHCTVWRDEGVSLRNIGYMLYGHKCNFQEQRKVKVTTQKGKVRVGQQKQKKRR